VLFKLRVILGGVVACSMLDICHRRTSSCACAVSSSLWIECARSAPRASSTWGQFSASLVLAKTDSVSFSNAGVDSMEHPMDADLDWMEHPKSRVDTLDTDLETHAVEQVLCASSFFCPKNSDASTNPAESDVG